MGILKIYKLPAKWDFEHMVKLQAEERLINNAYAYRLHIRHSVYSHYDCTLYCVMNPSKNVRTPSTSVKAPTLEISGNI